MFYDRYILRHPFGKFKTCFNLTGKINVFQFIYNINPKLLQSPY